MSGYLKFRIVKPGGPKMQDNYHFLAESSDPIDADKARELQLKLGYHPAGYGFESFKLVETPSGYIATWECQGSCD